MTAISQVAPTPIATPARVRRAAIASSSPLDAVIDRVQRSADRFELSHARRAAGAILAGTAVACTVAGNLAAAFLPPAAALGVSAALSLGIAAAGGLAANQVMHGVYDKGMLGGACVLSFFMGFASAGSLQQMGSIAALLVPSALGVGVGALFGSRLETTRFGLGKRLSEARALADRYARYQAQHAALEQEMQRLQGSATGSPPPAQVS